jgi:hypothetical protein
MAQWQSDHLADASGVGTPYDFNQDFADSTPWDYPSDWSMDSVAGLVGETSGPYEPGENILVKMTLNNPGDELDLLTGRQENYDQTGSTNGEITVVGATAAPTLEYEVVSDADDGTYTIYATYDEIFNRNAGTSGVGDQQSIDIDVLDYQVSLTASGESDTEILLEYTIEQGDPDYSIEIFRKLDSEADTAFTSIHTDTHTSTGTYSHTDGGLDSSNTYEYKIEVTDNSAETVTDRATASPIASS